MQHKTLAGTSPEVAEQLIALFTNELVQSVEQIIPLGFDQLGQCHVVVLFEPAPE